MLETLELLQETKNKNYKSYNPNTVHVIIKNTYTNTPHEFL